DVPCHTLLCRQRHYAVKDIGRGRKCAQCRTNKRKRVPISVVKITAIIYLEVMRTALLAALLAACAMSQDAAVEQLFAGAMEAQQRGDFSLAVTNYQQIVKRQPEFFGAWANLGVALVKLGRFD